ncbi:hypothetical protein D3C84_1166050 [compost metagenome]
MRRRISSAWSRGAIGSFSASSSFAAFTNDSRLREFDSDDGVKDWSTCLPLMNLDTCVLCVRDSFNVAVASTPS